MSRPGSTYDSEHDAAHAERYGEGYTDGNGGSRTNGRSTSARDFSSLVAEIKEYAGHFAAAKLDAVKSSVRNVVLYAVLGVLGLCVGATIVVTASVLLLLGAADGIGAIFEPDRPFVGKLIVSVIVLGGVVAGALLMMKKLGASSKKQTIDKYESRQRSQRAQFGRDVDHVE